MVFSFYLPIFLHWLHDVMNCPSIQKGPIWLSYLGFLSCFLFNLLERTIAKYVLGEHYKLILVCFVCVYVFYINNGIALTYLLYTIWFNVCSDHLYKTS